MPGQGKWIAVSLSLLLMTGSAAGCADEAPSSSAALAARACPEPEPDGDQPRPEPYAPDGTPYAGSGPHLLTLIKVHPPGHPNMFLHYGEPELPPEWQPPNEGGPPPRHDEPRDDRYRSMVELVVCEYIERTGSETQRCVYYGGTSVPVVEAQYSYRVFEATTAEPVGEFQLNGGGGDPCPSSVLEGSDDAALPEVPSAAEVAEALRPLVMAAR